MKWPNTIQGIQLPNRVRGGAALAVFASVGVFVAFCPDELGRWMIQHLGYYFTFAGVALIGVCLYRINPFHRLRAIRLSQWLACLAALLLGSWLLFIHGEFGNKIAMDDYILASSARNFHESKQYVVTDQVQMYESRYEPVATHVDKRPWLFPFLVSVVHDVIGFRPGNTFLVNAFFGVAFLLLVYLLGNFLAGTKAGFLAVLLWVSLPLLAQNATGGGMEMLNLFWLHLVFLCSCWYLRCPCRSREGLLSITAVLLAYARYESVLFLIPVLIVIIVGWVREKRCFLSWGSILSVAILLGALLQLKSYVGSEDGWELTRGATQAFALAYLPGNLLHALAYFYSFDDTLANSLFLSLLGVLCLIGFLVLFRSQWSRLWRTEALGAVFIVFAPFIVLNLLFLLCFHAARLDSPFVSRYALPFHALLVFSILYVWRHLGEHWPRVAFWKLAYFVLAAFLLGFTLPMNAKAVFTERNFAIREQLWLEDLSRGKIRKDSLVIDAFQIPWAYRDWFCLSPGSARSLSYYLVDMVKTGEVSGIHYVERLYLKNGNWVPDRPDDTLGPGFELELMAERSFRPFMLTRVYRVVNIGEK
ncbi:ArnT family glycosyltransferase [Coraliomargarita parva]|uniref:ArnT family glycosyltransferase n=1 Tax=Coraliomargarita parva TaxID=3014050 RepID=UPI0022B36671|nr:glycosyltransferase family 39 protein [Coraliomargarita parva]